MFCFSYNPQNSSITTHTESMEKVTGSFSAKYENLMLVEDISATEFDTSVKIFCDIYSFKNLIKSRFPPSTKAASINPVFKNMIERMRQNIDRLVCCQTCHKF